MLISKNKSMNKMRVSNWCSFSTISADGKLCTVIVNSKMNKTRSSPSRTHPVHKEIVHIIRKQCDWCPGSSEEDTIHLSWGDIHRDSDILVRMRNYQYLLVVGERVPNVSIYSFMNWFVHFTFVNEYLLYVKNQYKCKNEQNTVTTLNSLAV